MNWPGQCAVVIPCRNEGASIGALVREVRRELPAVLVIDDGSSDHTLQQARDAGAEIISNATPLGKGAALRTGWKRARELGFDWALCMDGDGQHAPDDIPGFLDCAERTGASLIIGNRMGEAHEMPLVRRVVNRWMSRGLSRMAGQEFPDSQCGFRLVRLDALERIQLSATRFEIESEQLLAFAAAGERIEFVPIQVIYRAEQSKIHPLRDTVRWFRWRRQWLATCSRIKSSESQSTNAPSRH